MEHLVKVAENQHVNHMSIDNLLLCITGASKNTPVFLVFLQNYEEIFLGVSKSSEDARKRLVAISYIISTEGEIPKTTEEDYKNQPIQDPEPVVQDSNKFEEPVINFPSKVEPKDEDGLGDLDQLGSMEKFQDGMLNMSRLGNSRRGMKETSDVRVDEQKVEEKVVEKVEEKPVVVVDPVVMQDVANDDDVVKPIDVIVPEVKLEEPIVEQVKPLVETPSDVEPQDQLGHKEHLVTVSLSNDQDGTIHVEIREKSDEANVEPVSAEIVSNPVEEKQEEKQMALKDNYDETPITKLPNILEPGTPEPVSHVELDK
jgi:hypothetical protein